MTRLPDRRASAWRDLGLGGRLSPAVLAEILDGGQAFRWSRSADGSWQGAWGGHAARLRLDPDGRLEWAPVDPLPGAGDEALAAALRLYLGGGTDLAAAVESLPWRSDAHLARCLAAFPGLRILRQPFGETLLCFLCSSAKRITQIKQAVGLLAARHGRPVTAGADPVRALPTWEVIADLPERALRECLLGFRAGHIHRAARFLAERPGWLAQTEVLPYGEARARLCSLPGVGEKIADCTLLFGAGMLESFPVDVWILKAMAARYGLEGWKPAQVAHFGRKHFGPGAGLAQQHLFAWERAHGNG